MTTILAIEDEYHILENILETLELEGFEASGALNGREGIERAQSIKPDLILCDIMMPELNGYDVLMNLRTDPKTADIPFVFLTALGSHDEVRAGMQMGADDYLTKPFTPQELVGAINARMEKQAIVRQKYEQGMETLRHNIVYALPHEMRTPLSGLIGCADFLMMDAENIDPASIYNLGDVIMRSAKRLHHLTENYLLYAQITVLEQEPERMARMREQSFDYPASVLLELVELIGQRHERSADIKFDVDDGVVGMGYDDFRKIVEETLDNAVKFSKPGQPVLLRGKPLADGCYEVVIEDQGIGMGEAELDQIGAYMQFNRALYEQQGLGLGLTIAQRLTGIYQGSFNIESAPEQGTRVTIHLPHAQS